MTTGTDALILYHQASTTVVTLLPTIYSHTYMVISHMPTLRPPLLKMFVNYIIMCDHIMILMLIYIAFDI